MAGPPVAQHCRVARVSEAFFLDEHEQVALLSYDKTDRQKNEIVDEAVNNLSQILAGNQTTSGQAENSESTVQISTKR